jgi:hypothetical protein
MIDHRTGCARGRSNQVKLSESLLQRKIESDFVRQCILLKNNKKIKMIWKQKEFFY